MPEWVSCAGRKADAIKAYREATGARFEDAKEHVTETQRQQE